MAARRLLWLVVVLFCSPVFGLWICSRGFKEHDWIAFDQPFSDQTLEAKLSLAAKLKAVGSICSLAFAHHVII
jgi:hypothetical protein